jgi:hypothetical protein
MAPQSSHLPLLQIFLVDGQPFVVQSVSQRAPPNPRSALQEHWPPEQVPPLRHWTVAHKLTQVPFEQVPAPEPDPHAVPLPLLTGSHWEGAAGPPGQLLKNVRQSLSALGLHRTLALQLST